MKGTMMIERGEADLAAAGEAGRPG